MGKDYDKIFKENFEILIGNVAKRILGINPDILEEIPDYNHYTIERQPDFLKKVDTGNPATDYILQIEAQVKDSKKMLKRLFIYYGLLYEDYGLPVEQYVLYLGDKKEASMVRELVHKNVSFRFHVINMQTISHQEFIHSDKPEDVILAILCDFEDQEPEQIIETVLRRLKLLATDELDLRKYVKQLEILSKLRKLQEVTIKKLESMGLIYDLETDIRYLQGAKKERVKNQRTFILELFKEFPSFSAEKIAKMVHTSKQFVNQVIEEHKRQQNK